MPKCRNKLHDSWTWIYQLYENKVTSNGIIEQGNICCAISKLLVQIVNSAERHKMQTITLHKIFLTLQSVSQKDNINQQIRWVFRHPILTQDYSPKNVISY